MLSYLQFIFKGGNELALAMENVDQFMLELGHVLNAANNCCIHSVEIMPNNSIEEAGRIECVMTLKDGLQFPCWIEEMMVSRVTDFPEVVSCCHKVHLDAVMEMREQSVAVDQRIAAATVKLLGIEDMDTKLDLLLQCLNRKKGYLAGLEALVDGLGLPDDEGHDNVKQSF